MNNKYPFSDHEDRNRNLYMPLVQSSENSQHQTPNALGRVRKFISSIECSDPKLLHAIAQAQNAKDLL